MRGLFLRSYLRLALIALVAVALTHLLIARQVRGTIEERVDDALRARIELVRDRVARGEHADGDVLHEALAPPPPEPTGQTLVLPTDPLEDADSRPGRPGRDERVASRRSARSNEALQGLGPVRVVPLDEIALSESDRALLASGEIVRFDHRGGRAIAARIDDSRALLIGPGRPILPRIMLVHQGITLATLLMVVGVGLWLLQRPIEARLSRVAQAAQRWTAGERTARSGVAGDDPVGKVGEQFDTMAAVINELLARREELLRSVSHELRTPLARLTLLQEQASETRDPAEQQQAVERMRRSIHEMTMLVEELLAFARIDGGTQAIPVSVPLLAVAREAAAATDPTSLEVRVVGQEVTAWGEARDLERAVGNLVRNAVAHARTQVVVTVGVSGADATLDVDDDGSGVALPDRERIFEPFVRLDNPSQRPGSGLGLAIVQRAVTRMGGTVRCETSPLGGARFRITLRRVAPK